MIRFTVALAIIMLVALAGCKAPMCSLVKQGITQLEKELAEDTADVPEFDEVLEPILKKSDILDDAKEIWDRIPDEQKMEAGLAALRFINENWCGVETKLSALEKQEALLLLLEGYARK